MIKKIITSTIGLVLGICVIGMSESYAAEQIGTITTSSLNVRSGSSVNYRVVGNLGIGNKVTILGSNSGWYKVKAPNNNIGWASSKYIKVVESNSVTNTTYENNISKNLKVVATAYTGYGITSTGQKPVWGTIAVDPRVIPYGTKVYIPCFNQVFIANNTGGAIKGNKIDIYMNNNNQCNNWGRRTIDIQILK